jgi:hypothetical protein
MPSRSAGKHKKDTVIPCASYPCRWETFLRGRICLPHVLAMISAHLGVSSGHLVPGGGSSGASIHYRPLVCPVSHPSPHEQPHLPCDSVVNFSELRPSLAEF